MCVGICSKNDKLAYHNYIAYTLPLASIIFFLVFLRLFRIRHAAATATAAAAKHSKIQSRIIRTMMIGNDDAGLFVCIDLEERNT